MDRTVMDRTVMDRNLITAQGYAFVDFTVDVNVVCNTIFMSCIMVS